MKIIENTYFIFFLLSFVFIQGCASPGMFGRRSLLADSALARDLPGSARSSAIQAMETALASKGSSAVTWRDEASGDWGVVRLGQASIMGLTPGRTRLGAPAGLYVGAPLETALGEYDLARNANVRLGPFTTARKLTTLASGLHVRALGRENVGDWILVARDDVALGYIYGPLLKKSMAGDLILAGGPSVVPTYCRAFTHEIRLRDGRSETWEGRACRSTNGQWRLAPKDQG